MKVGLVLEGGAMRCMFTAGVRDVFMDNGIDFDCIVGVSAGALFGVNYLSKQKGRVIRYTKRFNGDKNYVGLLPLIREGNIISTSYAYYKVPMKLDPFDNKIYMKSKVPFYAVVTNVETGKPEYIKIDNVFKQMEVFRATSAMPFLSKAVRIGSKAYLDGGISDSIPYLWLSKQGYDKIIVVLTQDINYRKKPMSKYMIDLYYRAFPRLSKRLTTRHNRYNRSYNILRYWESCKKAFVIRPSRPIKIKRMERDPNKLQEIYDLGVKDCENAINSLLEYLED